MFLLNILTKYLKNNELAWSFKLISLQLILVLCVIIFYDQQKYAILLLYLVASSICFLNTKYLLYIFYSSIWISFKLYFEVAGIVVRLSDIIFLFMFISYLFNSFYKKKLIINTPKKNDYFIISFVILCIYSLITSLNKLGTIVEIIQVFQLVFLYYFVKSIVSEDKDIAYFMITTIIFGLLDSFWIFSAVLSNGVGGRYIGILEIIPDELPFSILFLYLFYLSEKQIFHKFVKLILLLILSLSMLLTMGRGLLIISSIMFLSSTSVYFISKKKYLNLILTLVVVTTMSLLLIASSQLASTRYGSIVKGGENTNMRLYNWYSSSQIIKKYPLTGVGLGNDTDYLKSYLPDFSPEIVKRYGGDTPHNEILHFGIQTGVFGILFVLFFYSNLIFKSFNILINKRLESQTIANALFSISIGIFVWSLANDVILAGKGSFVVLLSAFIDKIIDNDTRKVDFR